MAKRAYGIVIRMTIHPLFLPILLSMVLYGNISYYALILTSLLIHELGHIVAAYFLKVKVLRCVLMPYGGEIELQGGYSLAPFKQLLIALGGPIATPCCLAISPLLDPLIAEPLIKIQLILLAVNLIPIWPLDGGRIAYCIIVMYYKKVRVYEKFLVFSFLAILLTLLITFIFLPKSLFLFILSLFLFIQIIGEWRFRKYRIAFEKHVLNRLT